MASSNLTIFASFIPEGTAISCNHYLQHTADKRADMLSNGIEPSLATKRPFWLDGMLKEINRNRKQVHEAIVVAFPQATRPP
eukprot:13542692-Heterocapsa_arctica.AAC.1